MHVLKRTRTGFIAQCQRQHQKPGSLALRPYHDESFGYRKPHEFVFPDYTPAQLENRAANANLLRYVDSMRVHGHRAARIDPLDLIHREEVAALDPSRYALALGAKEQYDVDGIVWTRPVGQASAGQDLWTLEDIVSRLRGVYVGRIGYEYMHSTSKTERLWFSHLLESQSLPGREDSTHALAPMTDETRKRIHELLARSEVFDNFLQAKFPNLKRYGLEGGESMLPALDALFGSAALSGVRHAILAMPHRGRLNLLTDLLRYPPSALFHKIKGGSELPEGYGAEGDVLSHLVSSPVIEYGDGRGIKVSLQPNPSHLEAANPVALGKTRAKQFALLKDSPGDCKLGDRVMCVQLHGDASFIGQGVVMEGLGMSNLPHFTSGGSVHLVVDNNIGYTTPASGARSSMYCSDVGKMINAPVLHVNGDHPEDVARAMEVAFRYRDYFRKDIIVDLLVYRRWGHNELDLPGITSPLMYEKIAVRKSVPQLYEEKLLTEGVLTPADIAQVRGDYKAHLEAELAKVNVAAGGGTFTPWYPEVLGGAWKDAGIVWPTSGEAVHCPDTGVEREVLEKVGRASVCVPDGFEIHPKLHRHVKNRLQSIEKGAGIDWATAEAMALGTLMLEGNDVRISGQDVGRGTFSHRHAMLVNQKTEGVIVPLNDELGADGKLELANSSLSEMGVLGFEYGVSWERPSLLPIWEAQFGDFFNGAQIIIDTYISSAETKWLRQSGLVMMLPHGLDGAGPEHSSSRIERMLQLTNDRYTLQEAQEEGAEGGVNMHVVYPTTPAQYFHLLRRQMRRNYRKPLVIAGPKGLLRLSAASSSLSEFEPGTQFQPVLDDPAVRDKAGVKRVLLVSGKIYYELVKERQARGLSADEVVIVRVEELAPFPFGRVLEVLGGYQGGVDVVWVQEEGRNQGGYGHVKDRVGDVLGCLGWGGGVRYWGRRESAVPAPGIGRLYQEQQREVLEGAFRGL
ncbi:dehydrogenase E1 and transketolase domain-containing protein 1 [Coprinopsis marcescibilis]|uniref:Dehydrogenase E1 and transketolase domain-containing protein 1 n=1 Tax=Coprinopsis marcescibilis TaxID=230819 RepID=A0A5C3KME0_COPMA|nr:dehydrogenase E1 and transketolase domain-containing protein 1 [Coprinopsis marcescibilis]